MNERIEELIVNSQPSLVQTGLVILTIILTLFFRRLFKRYLLRAAPRRHFDERRVNAISKLGQALIIAIAVAVVSNVLGFGIQGIVVATSSLFALVGIAFFAVWSILSNVTSSIIIYFTFPFRIGDRIQIENEPSFSGVLKDITLFYLRVQTDDGEIIAIPANVAIQKIIITRRRGSTRPRREPAALPR